MLRALLLLVRKSHSPKVRRKFNGVCPYGRILTYETVLIGDSLDPPFLTDLATDFCVFRKSRNRLGHFTAPGGQKPQTASLKAQLPIRTKIRLRTAERGLIRRDKVIRPADTPGGGTRPPESAGKRCFSWGLVFINQSNRQF